MLKTWTKVEFPGKNYDDNNDINDSMTITLLFNQTGFTHYSDLAEGGHSLTGAVCTSDTERDTLQRAEGPATSTRGGYNVNTCKCRFFNRPRREAAARGGYSVVTFHGLLRQAWKAKFENNGKYQFLWLCLVIQVHAESSIHD